MKIIGIWEGSISGELTTLIDLYYNLKKYIDVKFFICLEKKELLSSCIRHLIQNNNQDLLQNITLQKTFNSSLIICTSFLLYKSIDIISDNIFILDTLDLVKNDYVLPQIDCSNVILFSNPANITDKIIYPQKEYYHKFSEKRLNNLPTYYRPSLYNGKTDLFLHDVFKYNRTSKPFIKISHNEYFENVGKRIFEHLYHGKTVYYNRDGFSNPDGLFYYLKLFNIDGNISCHLKLSEHIIKEKLFMSEDDELLKTIRNLKCQ